MIVILIISTVNCFLLFYSLDVSDARVLSFGTNLVQYDRTVVVAVLPVVTCSRRFFIVLFCFYKLWYKRFSVQGGYAFRNTSFLTQFSVEIHIFPFLVLVC